MDLAQGTKKLVEENSRSFSEAYSIKKVLNGLRSSMRIELAEMHDRLVDGKNGIIEAGINSEESNKDSSEGSDKGSKKNKKN